MSFKIFTILFSVVIYSQAPALACENSFDDLIVGRWQFYKYFYEGQENPPPNPHLKLNFAFYDTGTSRLWWVRDNEPGFCERIGQFSYEKCELKDEVLWVNPKNNLECSNDPDMRLGNKTQSKLEIINGDLHLHLSLGGQPFIYIWKRVLDSSMGENK